MKDMLDPSELTDRVAAQAGKVKLQGFGLKDLGGSTTPFPIPENGLEVIWNHLVRYLGGGVVRAGQRGDLVQERLRPRDHARAAHRIVAARVPGMTPRDATDRQPAAPQGPVPADRLLRVTGTGGMETAVLPEQRAQEPPIELDESDQDLAHRSRILDQSTATLAVISAFVALPAAGLAFSLAQPGLSYLSGAYALGGLTAGLFAPLGRLASAAAFVISNGVASLQVGARQEVVTGLYEVAAATVIYLVVPAKAGVRLMGLFSRSEDTDRAEGLRRSVIMKLDYAAKALGSVSEAVGEVSEKLSKTCAPDISGVYHRTADEVCATCGLKGYCWERGFNDSMDAFNALTGKLRANGKVGRGDFNPQFAAHCGRLSQIVEAVNRNYGEFSVRDAAERRAQQVRGTVATQFATTADILEDMAAELELCEKFDFAAAQKIEEVLRLAGVQPIDVSCRTDRFGHMSVEAVAAPGDCVRLNRAQLAQEISRVCGRAFELPCVSSAGGKCRIRMDELPLYRAKTGCAQHVCGNGRFCGDSWKCFPDGSGRQIAMICDGMGTGGRAAVDGAMASGIMERLVRAGVSFDAALKIVNSALMVKSGDESLSTMDIAAVDLYSGGVELMKAGAPLTILRRGGRAVPVDMPGLPVGILNDTRFARTSDTLQPGDLLVMLSDGALSSGTEWVCGEIEKWDGKIPQELAETLVSQAIARRSDGHDDDITVLALMLAPRREEA